MKKQELFSGDFKTLGEFSHIDKRLFGISLEDAAEITQIADRVSRELEIPVKTITGTGIRVGRKAKKFHESVITKALEEYFKPQQ